ncbi:DKNYY domain-containing protein [Pluralibacter gergoviae]
MKYLVGFIVIMSILLTLPYTKLTPDKYRCQEIWINTEKSESTQAEDRNRQLKSCTKDDKPVTPSTKYFIKDGNVYKTYVVIRRYDPTCINGGGPGNMGQIFIPICWLPDSWHRMSVDEQRTFLLISHDSKHFKIAPTEQSVSTTVNKDDYVLDQSSVYYIANKIPGADPDTFKATSSFDKTPQLARYAIARDKNHLYINGTSLPLNTLEQIKWLDLPCRDNRYNCFYPGEEPVLGVSNNDLLYISSRAKATLIKDIGKQNITCFLRNRSIYCTSEGRDFTIDRNNDGKVDMIIHE